MRPPAFPFRQSARDGAVHPKTVPLLNQRMFCLLHLHAAAFRSETDTLNFISASCFLGPSSPACCRFPPTSLSICASLASAVGELSELQRLHLYIVMQLLKRPQYHNADKIQMIRAPAGFFRYLQLGFLIRQCLLSAHPLRL